MIMVLPKDIFVSQLVYMHVQMSTSRPGVAVSSVQDLDFQRSFMTPGGIQSFGWSRVSLLHTKHIEEPDQRLSYYLDVVFQFSAGYRVV